MACECKDHTIAGIVIITHAAAARIPPARAAMRNEDEAEKPVVLAIGNTYLWIGATHTPVPLRPVDESPGAFAAAVCGALRLVCLRGHRVVCVGAPTYHRRVTVAHAMLKLMRAASVRFIDVPTAARVAAEAPHAMVVDVAAPRRDAPDDPRRAAALTNVYRSGAPQLTRVGAAEAVLAALAKATVPERADAAQRIVLCGAMQPGLLLHEVRTLANNAPQYQHLVKLTLAARVVPTPYNPTFVPWFGGVIIARAEIDVGYVVEAQPWIKHGALVLPDEDAIAHVELPEAVVGK